MAFEGFSAGRRKPQTLASIAGRETRHTSYLSSGQRYRVEVLIRSRRNALKRDLRLFSELSSAVEREMPESLTLVPGSDTVHEMSIYCARLCGEFGTTRPHQEALNSQDDEPLIVVLRISRTVA